MVVAVFMLSKNPQSAGPLLVYPTLMLSWLGLRHAKSIALESELGDQESEMVGTLARACHHFRLIFVMEHFVFWWLGLWQWYDSAVRLKPTGFEAYVLALGKIALWNFYLERSGFPFPKETWGFAWEIRAHTVHL